MMKVICNTCTGFVLVEEDTIKAEDYSEKERFDVHFWKLGTALRKNSRQFDESKERLMIPGSRLKSWYHRL